MTSKTAILQVRTGQRLKPETLSFKTYFPLSFFDSCFKLMSDRQKQFQIIDININKSRQQTKQILKKGLVSKMF